ncbi:MAG: hypothetical protein OHK0031_17990 [Anaerolineales bacterium]
MAVFLPEAFARRLARHLNNLHIALMALRVARLAPSARDMRPVAFFKASSGLDDLSWNSAFHLLTSWGLRLQGIPVAYFACDHGLSRCVLGTNRDNPAQNPPCRSCVYQSKTLYVGSKQFPGSPVFQLTGQPENRNTVQPSNRPTVSWFTFTRDAELEDSLRNLPLSDLAVFTWQEIPLGGLCLPGLRWILRRHNLQDDDSTRFFLREYMLSAFSLARRFEHFLDQTQPQVVVVFNGQFYPEATAKWVAKRRGLRVITHEVGLLPMTGFFTEGEATIYPISLPENFDLNEAQNARLDAYLEKRFQGNFSMAGVKFWPSMRGLDADFLAKAAKFKQIVPVFTNVIFDTSQPHANTLFRDMFAWLDVVLETAKNHPETLFVIRAHPDETRLRKASLETVAEWMEKRRAADLPNLVFVPPQEFLSSYQLIQRAKFVMIYNSTIGLEAAILGAAVLCAGKARFTQYPTVFFPPSADEYRQTLEDFLAAENVPAPEEFRRNARRFLYYQLFRSSLPFDEFLESGVRSTHARLKRFDPRALLHSPAIQTVSAGLLENGDFLLPEGEN